MNTEAYQNRKLETLRALQHEKEAELEIHLVKTVKLRDEIIRVKLDYARTANEPLPIFSIPNEISLMIFHILHDYTQLGYRCDTKRNYADHERCTLCRSATMDISQVCHSWRTLALWSLELWSTFNYTGREWGFANIRLLLCIQRSRDCLLDIKLDFPLDCHEQIPAVVDMLLPHFWRVRLLSLRVDASQDPIDFFNCLKEDGPVSADNLETLEIFSFGSDYVQRFGYGMPIDSVSTFKDGKVLKLASLRTRGCDYNFYAHKSHHITVLHVDDFIEMEWETFEYVLKLPGLTALTLSPRIDDPPLQQLSTVAPNLRYFRSQSGDILSHICLCLQAPLLELLVFRNINIYYWGDPFNGVSVRQHEPFPSLKTISFINCYVPFIDAFFYNLAQATANITHLMVYYGLNTSDSPASNSGSVFLKMLKNSNMIYWPKLEAISYHRSRHQELEREINMAQLAEMLEHRATQLRTHCTYQFSDKDLDELEHEEGTDGTVWRSLRTGEFHNIMCSWMWEPTENPPWPSQLSKNFHYSSELDFCIAK